MAKAKTDRISETETDDAKKDFKGSKVEGKKAKTDDSDPPVTCETVIRDLRKKKHPI